MPDGTHHDQVRAHPLALGNHRIRNLDGIVEHCQRHPDAVTSRVPRQCLEMLHGVIGSVGPPRRRTAGEVGGELGHGDEVEALPHPLGPADGDTGHGGITG